MNLDVSAWEYLFLFLVFLGLARFLWWLGVKIKQARCKHWSWTAQGWSATSSRWELRGRCDNCGRRNLLDFESFESPRGRQMTASCYDALEAAEDQ